MALKSTDKFANKFYGTATETGAATLTFSEIKTSVDVFSKQAWILHRLEWYISAADIEKLVAAGDYIEAALTATDKISALGLGDAGVIDLFQLQNHFATAVGYTVHQKPFIRDFTGMPGGGLIIAPRPLYVAVKGTSLASAVSALCRGYFTNLAMSADEYLELVDFYRIVQ